MKRLFLVCLFVLASLGLGLCEQIDDGFYAVVRKEDPTEKVSALGDHELRVEYNPIFLDGDDEELSVVVKSDSFVPILLKESPQKTQDTTDRTQFWLHISLADEATEKLETFTRDNLGGTVAVVVGQKVVTMHKIKSVIKGGKLQISRCGDNGCQVLYRELNDNIKSDPEE